MKHFFVVIGMCVSLSLISNATADSAVVPRVQADALAKKEFLQLNFFSQGGGMHLVPDLISLYDTFSPLMKAKFFSSIIEKRWGFNIVDGEIVGLFSIPYKGMKIGALGCVACHSGKAAGVFVPGLGNKNIDVGEIGRGAFEIESLYSKIPHLRGGADYKEVKKSALEFAKLLSDRRWENLSQGMVPVAFIRQWFYKQAGLVLPDDIPRGAVKVPSLWGYGEKRKVGQFSDGFGDGTQPGWAIAVELTGGQKPEVVREYLPKVEHAENLFSDFLPPKYPFAVNPSKASRGADVFTKTCAGCHGSYVRDADDLPIYEAPKLIGIEKVQTDTDRLDANTDLFYDLVAKNPLSDVIKANRVPKGYFAQRLVGIWSRFPYWHNSAIPNIRALLTKPELRPRVFSLEDAGERLRFDETALGLTVPLSGSLEESKLLSRAKKGDRRVYDVSRVGHSNQGHRFGVDLSDEDKSYLIEYLKTL